MTEAPAPYGNRLAFDTRTPLDRFLEAAHCRTQLELAAFLGVRQTFIADAKRRAFIPAEWLLTLLRLKGVNPEWVLTGQGPQYLCACLYAGTLTHKYATCGTASSSFHSVSNGLLCCCHCGLTQSVCDATKV